MSPRKEIQEWATALDPDEWSITEKFELAGAFLRCSAFLWPRSPRDSGLQSLLPSMHSRRCAEPCRVLAGADAPAGFGQRWRGQGDDEREAFHDG